MKTLFLTPLFLFLFHFCFALTDSGKVVITGKFKNYKSESVSIENSHGKQIYSGTVPVSGESIITLNIGPGYYNLSFAEELASLYLKPGFELQVTIDMNEFDESIRFTGKGSSENNFLADKYLKSEAFIQENGFESMNEFTEEKFLAANDSLYRMKMDLLAKAVDLDGQFRYYEEQTNDLERRQALLSYPMMKRFSTGDMNFTVSKNFPDPILGLNMNDEKLLAVSIYEQLLENHLFLLASKVMEKSSGEDFSVVCLAILDTTINNTEVKEQLAFSIVNMGIGRSQHVEQLYAIYSSLYKNEANRKIIDEKYLALNTTRKGQPSPDFKFNDLSGKSYSLSDFRGKYVYIDIWATWCQPCLREIPHLKTLESELKGKNIAFVSICCMDTKDKWAAMIQEKELSGFQLFAEDDHDPFLKKYVVQGIPRFILLDTEGKIIDHNAKRPSDPELKELLNNLN